MTPKDRVKVNVYKQLFLEEKKKNKFYVRSCGCLLGLFIITASTLHFMDNKSSGNESSNYAFFNEKSLIEKTNDNKISFDKKINNYDKEVREKINLNSVLLDDVFDDNNSVNFTPINLFANGNF